jgi:hypothetical protein
MAGEEAPAPEVQPEPMLPDHAEEKGAECHSELPH